jgi:hypothetical protein
MDPFSGASTAPVVNTTGGVAALGGHTMRPLAGLEEGWLRLG